MVEVVPDEIRRSAGHVSTVAQGINTHNPAKELSGVGAALPGSLAAAAATTLTTNWESRFPALHKDMTSHSSNLRGAANTWNSTDHQVANGYPSTP